MTQKEQKEQKEQKVRLVPFEECYLEEYRKWVNDPEIKKMMGRCLPVVELKHKGWYRRLVSSRSAVVFSVVVDAPSVTHGAKRYVGNVWLWGIDWRHRNAEVRILLGNDHGKGYGTDAINQIADFVFGALNLEKVYAYVIKSNERAVKAFGRAGFDIEGILKKHWFVGRRYVDVLIMAQHRETIL